MKLQINLNEHVKVKLNAMGLKILVDSGWTHMKPDKDGFYEFQLHLLMSIFGPHVGFGFNQPFEDVSIYLESWCN